MSDPGSEAPSASAPTIKGLGGIARGALLWGAGFTLMRDVLQFAAMLLLVRLLSPADYGRAALAQTILGVASVFSFKVLIPHALQIRDPREVDWQAHFTAGAVMNLTVMALTLLVAGGLSLTSAYAGAALPLAGFSLVFLIEVPASLRLTMVQAEHDWPRFRVLTLIGTMAGLGSALLLGFIGAGVWALVAPVLLFGFPAAVDLFLSRTWRPDWSWSWRRFRETARFGFNRVGSSGMISGRQAVEQLALTSAYRFEGLGVFTRSTGLATLAAGRIGTLVVSSLFPVLTRAEAGSPQFRQMSGLLLRGIAWTTIPAGLLLAVEAPEIVGLLYGAKWGQVAPLMPFASAFVSVGGVVAACYSLLLANNEFRACLFVDVVSAVLGAGLALWLVPMGPGLYLSAAAVSSTVVLAIVLTILVRTGGLDVALISAALVPPLAAGLAAVGTVEALGLLSMRLPGMIKLGVDTAVFGAVFLLVLRFAFARSLDGLLDVAPGRALARRLLRLAPPPAYSAGVSGE